MFLHMFLLKSILVVLHLWSRSNFLLSIFLLSGDVEMIKDPSLFLRKTLQYGNGISIAVLLKTILKYSFLKHI